MEPTGQVEQPARKFSISNLALGLLSLIFAFAVAASLWQDVMLCRRALRCGTECIANVTHRGISYSHDSRGRLRTSHDSVLEYDGYTKSIPFWPEGDAVPVIYLEIGGAPTTGSRVTSHHAVLVGRKSDGFLTIYSRNFGWVRSMFWALFALPAFLGGVVMTAAGFRPSWLNDTETEQKHQENSPLSAPSDASRMPSPPTPNTILLPTAASEGVSQKEQAVAVEEPSQKLLTEQQRFLEGLHSKVKVRLKPEIPDSKSEDRVAAPTDASEQVSLGDKYYTGAGVPTDRCKAAEWYLKAAQQNHALAQLRLGHMYMKGDGVPRNTTTGAVFFRQAAEQGLAEAQAYVGDFYREGKLYIQDYEKALEWYTKAAAQGEARALLSLVHMHLSGEGVPPRSDTAVEYFAKVWKQRESLDRTLRRRFIELLGSVVREWTPSEPTTEEIIAWLATEAERGDTCAQARLGGLFLEGKVVKQDYSRAVAWLTRAAENGDMRSARALAHVLQRGPVTELNYSQAIKWYHFLALHGEEEGIHCLGDMLALRQGADEELVETAKALRAWADDGNRTAIETMLRLLDKRPQVRGVLDECIEVCRGLAANGDLAALRRLGDLYYQGELLAKDWSKAAGYYRRAAEKNDTQAQLRLAEILVASDGFSEEAWQWFAAAASRGCGSAQHKLARAYLSAEGRPFDPEKAATWTDRLALQNDRGWRLEAAQLYLLLARDERVRRHFASIEERRRKRKRRHWLHYMPRAEVEVQSAGKNYFLKRALHLFKELAAEGDPESQYQFASMLLAGEGKGKPLRCSPFVRPMEAVFRLMFLPSSVPPI